MSDRSKIEWTDATWNPVRGCTRVSEGCRNCYAEVMAARFSGPGDWGEGFARIEGGDHRWTGKVALIEAQLEVPLRWKRPRRIFVNATSDLFHESLPDEAIDKVVAVMALSPGHVFQVLTKRAARMRDYVAKMDAEPSIAQRLVDAIGVPRVRLVAVDWPLPNLWLGVSVENQATADERVPLLLETPAALRFLSCEPLLGPVDFRDIAFPRPTWRSARSPGVGWVICGGESGPGARPMHPDWARALRDQCAAVRVPFFFKQWGEWLPSDADDHPVYKVEHRYLGGRWHAYRLGKGRAGALLDGGEYRQFPAIDPAARRQTHKED